MRTMIAALLTLALSACATAPSAHRYTGVYVWAFETEAFYAYDGGDPYWVRADSDAYAALQAAIPEPRDAQAGARIVAEVRGMASPVGRYGRLGAFTRELHITRVYSAHAEGGGS